MKNNTNTSKSRHVRYLGFIGVSQSSGGHCVLHGTMHVPVILKTHFPMENAFSILPAHVSYHEVHFDHLMIGKPPWNLGNGHVLIWTYLYYIILYPHVELCVWQLLTTTIECVCIYILYKYMWATFHFMYKHIFVYGSLHGNVHRVRFTESPLITIMINVAVKQPSHGTKTISQSQFLHG